jgi:uncharacterized membrane protein
MWCSCSGGRRGYEDRREPRESSPTAKEILKEWFARGEIGKAEFEEKRRMINES